MKRIVCKKYNEKWTKIIPIIVLFLHNFYNYAGASHHSSGAALRRLKEDKVSSSYSIYVKMCCLILIQFVFA
jgi:hypothetical protein